MKKFIKDLFVLGFWIGSISVAFVGGIWTNVTLRDPEFITKEVVVKDYQITNASGTSMFPTFSKKETSIITFTEMNPKVGDIITFECLPNSTCSSVYKETRYITHHLLSIKPDGCMEIRGDNVKTRDPNEPCYYPGKDIEILGVVKGLID